MQSDNFNPNTENSLMTIDELRALRLQKQKIENDRKGRKYIYEINQRYREMNDRKNNNFFKKINPFKKAS
mgnify:CR=1 FL=1|tara:strand:- start:1867 stop:2076 length:210 start_codon:yes stop_codon:yes gene_type:complete